MVEVRAKAPRRSHHAAALTARQAPQIRADHPAIAAFDQGGGQGSAHGRVLTPREIAGYAASALGPNPKITEVAIATAIAMCESTGRTHATNPHATNGTAYGLWQQNEGLGQALYDPATAASHMAATVRKAASEGRPKWAYWGCAPPALAGGFVAFVPAATFAVQRNAPYRNPLRGIVGLIPGRIDQGVDYAGSGPIYALGPGRVIIVQRNSSGWPGGGLVVYMLTGGFARGRFVYVAENVQVPPNVRVGSRVNSGTVIARLRPGAPHLETGWATRSGGTYARSHGGYVEGQRTGAGQSFSNLLAATGAPPGTAGSRPIVGTGPKGVGNAQTFGLSPRARTTTLDALSKCGGFATSGLCTNVAVKACKAAGGDDLGCKAFVSNYFQRAQGPRCQAGPVKLPDAICHLGTYLKIGAGGLVMLVGLGIVVASATGQENRLAQAAQFVPGVGAATRVAGRRRAIRAERTTQVTRAAKAEAEQRVQIRKATVGGREVRYSTRRPRVTRRRQYRRMQASSEQQGQAEQEATSERRSQRRLERRTRREERARRRAAPPLHSREERTRT